MVPYTLLSDLAFIFFLGSVLDLIINANPLIKLDGYYFLSQWLRLPNLMDRSRAYWRGLWRRIVSGEPDEMGAHYSQRERAIYALFGLLSSLYVVVLIGFIVLYIGDYLVDSFYLLGLLLTAGIALLYVRRPLQRILSAVASMMVRRVNMMWKREHHQNDERGMMNDEHRKFRRLLPYSSFIVHHSSFLRRRRFVPATLLLLIIGTMLMPWQASVGNYGTLIVMPGQEAIIRAPESATLMELRVHPGDWLASGAVVGRMGSLDLEDQIVQVQSELARANAEYDRLLGEYRVHEESAARAEVQWRQRQYDYDEIHAEQQQIHARQGVQNWPSVPGPWFVVRGPSEWSRGSDRLLVSGSLPGTKDEGRRTNYPATLAVLQAEVDLRQARLEEADTQLERAHRLATQGILPRGELEAAEMRSATLTIELNAARQRLKAALVDHRRQHASTATDMVLARSDVNAEHAQVEKLDGEMRTMRAFINTLQQRLDLLQRRQAQFQLVTPRAGAVFGEELPRLVGHYFPKGAEICRVAETHQLLVRIQVPEREIGDVRVGHPVRLRARAFPDHLFRGVVSNIGGEGEPDTHQRMTYRVELTIDNHDGLLRPGMTAFARIDFEHQMLGRILLHKVKQALRPELWML